MEQGNRRYQLARIGAALLLVGYWAGLTVGSQFAIQPPGVLYDLWYGVAPAVAGVVLAFVVGLYVAQWWLLIVALTPVVVLGVLELAGHQSPWHDSGPPLTQYGWSPVVWWLTWSFLLPLFLGVAIRRGLGPRARTKLRAAGKA